jgi:hypothetical protein
MLNSPSIKKKLFGESGLSGVRMANDAECPASVYFFCVMIHDLIGFLNSVGIIKGPSITVLKESPCVSLINQLNFGHSCDRMTFCPSSISETIKKSSWLNPATPI